MKLKSILEKFQEYLDDRDYMGCNMIQISGVWQLTLFYVYDNEPQTLIITQEEVEEWYANQEAQLQFDGVHNS